MHKKVTHEHYEGVLSGALHHELTSKKMIVLPIDFVQNLLGEVGLCSIAPRIRQEEYAGNG